jgi:hypothetical protein
LYLFHTFVERNSNKRYISGEVGKIMPVLYTAVPLLCKAHHIYIFKLNLGCSGLKRANMRFLLESSTREIQRGREGGREREREGGREREPGFEF